MHKLNCGQVDSEEDYYCEKNKNALQKSAASNTTQVHQQLPSVAQACYNKCITKRSV